jgi:hypothetical protein
VQVAPERRAQCAAAEVAELAILYAAAEESMTAETTPF